MHTEKELQNIVIVKDSSTDKPTNHIIELKKQITTHRLNTRKKFILNPIQFSTILPFIPFIFGLFQFLTNKINFQNYKTSFFQQNLPLFANLNPKLNYETLNYIVNLNSHSKIEVLNFGQSQLLAKVKKPNSLISKKINGISCNFYLLPSGNFLNDSTSQFLDDLPSYVQGLPKQNVETNFDNNLLLTFFKNQKKNNLAKGRLKNSNLKIKLQKLIFVPNSSKRLTLIRKTSSKQTPVKEMASIKNSFYKNRIEFFNSVNHLNREIQTLFIEKKIGVFDKNLNEKSNSPKESNRGHFLLENFFTYNSNLEENLLIETILADFEKKQISTEIIGTRVMSGYQYPDITSAKLNCFYQQNGLFKFFFKKTRSNFKNTEHNSYSPRTHRYFFTIKDLPPVLVETKKRLLQSDFEKKLVYEGPALVLDEKTAFDWKTHGDKNLRSWFHKYISFLNPFTQNQENFFGIYDSPKLSLEQKNFNKISDFKNQSLLEESYFPTHNRWEIVRAPLESLISPYLSSFHIPSEIKTEPFIRGLNFQVSKTEEGITNEKFIPIIQLQQPQFRSYDSKSNIFSGYSPLFDLGITSKPDYNLSIPSFNDNLFLTKYSSGRYTKTASIFSKQSRLIGSGFDNWEPLTFRSWLVISQLSFAVFIFQILKSLADNYGRELLGYLLDLVASLGFLDDSLKQEIEILMGQREKGFRVVLKSKKNFTDIVGIQKFLPEIYEVVWFLRNSARDFALSKTLPRGILLTGPPGTGKTLLVQALAGEAQVPVVVLSGSSLIEPGESGSVKLEMVFQEARQVAPCIVFIDEIDTLAQKRKGVVHNPMGNDDLVETLTSFEKVESESNKKFGIQTLENDGEENTQQLGLLTQLLIELDGIQGRDGVIVIGATNRPEVLDPALLRPGRFDKIIDVSLPKKKKRIEILKFYGQILGYEQNLPWEYLGERTVGFTAADLATLMNESAIKAILTKSIHTIETIEHGIDRLTTSESEKYNLLKTKTNVCENSNLEITSLSRLSTLYVDSKLTIIRLAYYQAGKVLLSYLLETHPKSVVASLWPRRPTIRSVQITTNLQNSLFDFARLSEINDRLVGCYAGKAAEFLFLENFSSRKSYHMSTLGLEDLLFGQKLIYSLLEKSFFYSKRTQTQKNINLFENLNLREFRETPGKLDFYKQFLEIIEHPPMKKAVETETSSLNSSKTTEIEKFNPQNYYSVPWWQQETSNTLEFVEKNFANWSRLYLSNPEQNERNPEWFPPDEYYHSSSGLKNVKLAFSNLKKQNNLTAGSEKTACMLFPAEKVNFSWNDVSKLTRDYPAQSIVLQSFNKALVLLNQNRELLDRLVIDLLYFEILRQPEIEKLLKDFRKLPVDKIQTKIPEDNLGFSVENSKKEKPIKILESAWGVSSRKSIPRWIDFAEFSEETT